ncbi:GrpB family protein [Phocaeicola salanitronis]|uniref:GrpB family protein n=1 Tax=Phocaeicola salanitronis TaxID=376805 RepID=UPI003D1887A0
MSIEHVGSISVQGLCAKPILVIILFSAQRDKYASCEKTLAQNTWKYVQNYADAKS